MPSELAQSKEIYDKLLKVLEDDSDNRLSRLRKRYLANHLLNLAKFFVNEVNKLERDVVENRCFRCHWPDSISHVCDPDDVEP